MSYEHLPPQAATVTTDGAIKVTGKITIETTFTITLRDGRLVHDESILALFRHGYQVLPVERS